VLLTAAVCETPAGVLARLRASNLEIARAAAAAKGPPAPASDAREDIRRWLAATGAAAEDLLQLEAWRRGTPAPWRPTVESVRAAGEPVARGALAVRGDDLLAAGVARGPEIGRLLDRLLDAVLADPALNSRERLLALVASWR
jgi:hypothetical protein